MGSTRKEAALTPPSTPAVEASGLAKAFGTTRAVDGVLRTPSAINNLSLLVLFPLTLASNIFVDPQTMPGWLQAFIDVNPITHVVTATRGLLAGTATVGQVGWVLAASAALTAVFAPLTMHLYRNKP
jgi:ABC-2 type transport system permease protein